MQNLVPLYLNDVLWKYAEVDVEFEEAMAECYPCHVTTAARRCEKFKTSCTNFTETVSFMRVVVPIGVGLNDVRYYGVHNCLRVNPNTTHPSLIYDVPSDPEDPYHGKHRST